MVPDVLAIHLRRRVAVLDTGEDIAICKMFDRWGDETDATDEALSLCMGPDVDGNWYAAPISAFDGQPN